MAKPVVQSEITEAAADEAKRRALQGRVEGCQREVEAVLRKHRCGLQAVVVLVGGQLPAAEVRIMPAE
jgi:hypothetical protein